ncbi:6960_t:CDS:2, partial [Funneliformis mosseae]
KELENGLEKVTQNSLFKDGLIFCLRSRTIHDSKIGSAEADPVSSFNDYKRGEAVEEVSYFSSHCLESEPDERKVKDEIGTQRDHLHVDQKSKEKHDSISTSPIIILGA